MRLVCLAQIRKRREFLKAKREEAKQAAEDGQNAAQVLPMSVLLGTMPAVLGT